MIDLERSRRSLAAAVLYALISVMATWPLLPQAATHLPLGSESVATVPFASAFALWWTADRAAHGFAEYWQAPIFHPSRDTFALSEPMPLAGLLVAPLLALGWPIALAYNVFVLCALTLNGWLAFRLLRALRLSYPAALGGGASVCLLPAVHHQLGVLTLVPLFGAIASLSAALRLLRAPSIGRGLGLGVALGATYLLCAQYALLLSLALGPALCIAAGRRALRKTFWIAALIAALALGLTIGPLAIAQRRAATEQQLARSPSQVDRGGAVLRSYRRSPPNPLLDWPGLRIDQRSGTALYPGSLRAALALAAGLLALGVKWRRTGSGVRDGLRLGRSRRQAIALLGALVVLEFVLSVSPHLPLGDASLRDVLARFLPGLAQIRSIWRAGVLSQLAIALLAAQGLHILHGLLARTARLRAWSGGLTCAIALLVACEVWPPLQRLASAPSARVHAAWAQFMRRELAPGEPYCVLPWVASGAVREFEDVSRFMLLTALHGRPMVNGYSSYFPRPHERLSRTKPRFGEPETARLLGSYGVRYVVVRSSRVDTSEQASPLGAVSDARERASEIAWERVFSDPVADLDVYRLPD